MKSRDHAKRGAKVAQRGARHCSKVRRFAPPAPPAPPPYRGERWWWGNEPPTHDVGFHPAGNSAARIGPSSIKNLARRAL